MRVSCSSLSARYSNTPSGFAPVNQLVPITMTASRRLQHPALSFIGFLRGLKAFGEASRSLDRLSESGNRRIVRAVAP